MRSKNRADHWQEHARQWARIASPLRPLPEDVELFRRLLGHDIGNYLLLGVTPELVDLGKQLVAVDLNAGMIGAVWPGSQPHRHVVQGSWLSLPFASAIIDGAVGDGSLSNLLYPQQYEQLWGELSRVLRPHGTVVLRVFATPESGESMHSILSAATKGKIKSFHAFKWRFAMAMVAELDTPNIAVASIYKAFERHFPDRAALSLASGWSMEEIATIDVYRNSQAVYSFPTVSELRHIWGGYFRETGMAHGTYELAERCPVIGLEKIE